MITKQQFIDQIAAEKANQLPIVNGDEWRNKFHLMAPIGWINDPNGLCYFKGLYHVFYQYSPLDAKGGLKFWGHYTSEDLLDWKYEGTALYPDSSYDCHGVYSGSSLIDQDKMHLFFTGNVKIDGGFTGFINPQSGNSIVVQNGIIISG